MADSDDSQLPPRVVRVWRSYLEGLGEEPTSPPPPDDGRPLDERDFDVRLPLRLEYLAAKFDHCVVIPWRLMVKAWRCLDGSIEYVIARALAAFLDKIRAEFGDETGGYRRADQTIFIYAEKRELAIKADPDELDLMLAYLRHAEIGGERPISLSLAFRRALEDLVANHGLLKPREAQLADDPTLPRPERELWTAPPEPADPAPQDELRALFARLAG